MWVDAGGSAAGDVVNRKWNHEKSSIPNAPFTGFGNLMDLPQLALEYRYAPKLPNAPLLNFLLDHSGVNQLVVNQDTGNVIPRWMQDLSLRGATLGQDTTDSAATGNLLAAAIDGAALSPVVLTVGQADFTPIQPFATDISNNSAILLDWQAGTGGFLSPPKSWTPIFLFQRPQDLDPTFDGDRTNFPDYPAHFDGTQANTTIPIYSLFFDAFLFNTVLPGNTPGPVLNMLYPRQIDGDVESKLLPRWPLETRAMMYIADQQNGVPGDPFTPDPRRPEALFTWDADDGLENGEYLLYVGTYLPGMASKLEAANLEALSGITQLPLLRPFNDNPDDVVHPVVQSILSMDPEVNPGTVNIFDPRLALDVITDPTRARGYDNTGTTGIVHPDRWTPAVEYRPGPGGYIFYGSNAAGGWQPRIVRVTDNFLALRVRNMGQPGRVAAITHIVLTPRKLTPGMINVNTAESSVARFRRTGEPTGTARDELWNPLLGLPGVVDVLTTMDWGPIYTAAAGTNPSPNNRRIQPTDAVAAPTSAQINPSLALAWTDPTTLASSLGGTLVERPYTDPDAGGQAIAVPPTTNVRNVGDNFGQGTDPLAAGYSTVARPEDEIAALRLTSMIMEGRVERPDGRYYTSLGEMVLDASAFARSNNLTNVAPTRRTIFPLSNEADPEIRFDDVRERIQRIGNLVTVQSDVFTIHATVQAGYGVDADGDGKINYRRSDEFVTTGERKIRVVYERRTPADRSDQANP
jgi:hypothetical protein